MMSRSEPIERPVAGEVSSSGPGEPFVLSVVVCTRDRPERLTACVESILDQSRRPDELIIIDDGQLDEPTRGALQDRCESSGVVFIYLHKTEPGLPKSRNLAVRSARGHVVQFFDDDVTLEPGFLEEVAWIYQADTDREIVGTDGTLLEPGPTTPGARVFDRLYRLAGWWSLKPRGVQRRLPRVLRRNRHRVKATLRIGGATMAFRRSALERHAFDEALSGYALGEDRDMAWRLAPIGWLVRLKWARAVHHHEPAGRPDHVALGRMVVGHYVHIMNRAGLTGVGDRLVIGYSLGVIAIGLLLFSCVNPRRYLPELWGMVQRAVGLLYAKASPVRSPP